MKTDCLQVRLKSEKCYNDWTMLLKGMAALEHTK